MFTQLFFFLKSFGFCVSDKFKECNEIAFVLFDQMLEREKEKTVIFSDSDFWVLSLGILMCFGI